jgi:ABC-2 type transport system permease protein
MNRAVIAQIRTEILMTLRRGESVLVTLLIPLGVLVFASRVDSVAPDGYDDAVDFVLPGVMALAVIAAAFVSLGIATGFERRYGVLKRLGATPLHRRGLVVAKTAAVVVLEVVQLIAIAVVGRFLGWSVPIGVIAAVGIVLLGTVAFAGLGLLLAGTVRAEATLAITNACFLLFLAIGGIVYPLDRLPDAIEPIARVLPSAALAESLRSVLVPHEAFAAGAFTALLAWAVVAPALATRWFRWEE